MRRNVIYVIMLAVALLSTLPLKADDCGSWLSVQVNKGWQNAYSFVRVENRTVQKFSKVEATFISAGGGYKFAPWLKSDLSYEFWSINPHIYTHKAVLCGTATLAREGLAVALREKLEFAVTPASSSCSWTLRTRLRAQYTIPDCFVRPYVMVEVFSWSDWIRTLHYAGAEFSFGKHSVIDAFYMYHLPKGAQPCHLVGLGYVFNF